MRILIAYGSKGKFYHLKNFSEELEKQNATIKKMQTEYKKLLALEEKGENIDKRRLA